MEKLKFVVLLVFGYCALLVTDVYAIQARSERLTIILDWFLNPDHAPLIVAQQEGFFNDQQLDVVFKMPSDPIDASKMVAADQADVGILNQATTFSFINAGLPLIRVGSLINRPLNCLVVDAKGPIHSIADLKGKRLGYSGDAVSDPLLSAVLQNNQLTFSDVELINIHFNLSQALLTGGVDGITSVMRNYELSQLRQAGFKPRAFFPEDNGVPNYDELVFIINKKNIHDKRMPRFLKAVQQGVEFLKLYPERSWKKFILQYPELDTDLNHQAWFATLEYFAERPASLDLQAYHIFGKFMVEHHMLNELKPLSEYAVEVSI